MSSSEAELLEAELEGGSFSLWATAIAVVKFDVDVGHTLSALVPSGALEDADVQGAIRLSLPDYNASNSVGDKVYAFRMRQQKTPALMSLKSAMDVSSSAPPPLSSAGDPFLFGYVFFRTERNVSAQRNFTQTSLVLLTHLAYVGLFKSLIRILGNAYFSSLSYRAAPATVLEEGNNCKHNTALLRQICRGMNSWESPGPGRMVSLEITGDVTFTATTPLQPISAVGDDCSALKSKNNNSGEGNNCSSSLPIFLVECSSAPCLSAQSSTDTHQQNHSIERESDVAVAVSSPVVEGEGRESCRTPPLIALLKSRNSRERSLSDLDVSSSSRKHSNIASATTAKTITRAATSIIDVVGGDDESPIIIQPEKQNRYELHTNSCVSSPASEGDSVAFYQRRGFVEDSGSSESRKLLILNRQRSRSVDETTINQLEDESMMYPSQAEKAPNSYLDVSSSSSLSSLLKRDANNSNGFVATTTTTTTKDSHSSSATTACSPAKKKVPLQKTASKNHFIGTPVMPSILDSVHQSQLPGPFQELNVYDSLRPVIRYLWNLWEIILIGQPLLILCQDAAKASDAVLSLVSLISPLVYAGDYRPYFNTFDSDFRSYQQMHEQNTLSPVLLGVTNPFFLDVMSNFPSTLVVEGNKTILAKTFTRGGSAIANGSSLIGGGINVIGNASAALQPPQIFKKTHGDWTNSLHSLFTPCLPRDDKVLKQLIQDPPTTLPSAKSSTTNRNVASAVRTTAETETSHSQPVACCDYYHQLRDKSIHQEQPPAEDSDVAAVNAINNSVIRRHFHELTQSFLRPFQPFFKLEIDPTVDLPLHEFPHLPKFREKTFLTNFAVEAPFRSLSRSRCVDLYRRFLQSPNFIQWFAAQRSKSEKIRRMAFLQVALRNVGVIEYSRLSVQQLVEICANMREATRHCGNYVGKADREILEICLVEIKGHVATRMKERGVADRLDFVALQSRRRSKSGKKIIYPSDFTSPPRSVGSAMSSSTSLSAFGSNIMKAFKKVLPIGGSNESTNTKLPNNSAFPLPRAPHRLPRVTVPSYSSSSQRNSPKSASRQEQAVAMSRVYEKKTGITRQRSSSSDAAEDGI